MKNSIEMSLDAMKKYKEYLEKRIAFLEDKLKSLPQDKLSYVVKGNTIQYYFHTTKNKKPKYLRKKDTDRINSLANAYYIRKTLPKLKQNLRATERFIASHSGMEERDVFYSMPRDMQYRNNNLFICKELYINTWLNRSFTRNPYKPEGLIHDTIRGEKVRSKSEAMIANALYNHNLPYLIEYPLKLKHSNRIIYPDFIILNPISLKEVYWEHFGMMGDLEYADEACRRIAILDNEGYKLSQNLFCTFESSSAPLSSTLIESYIQQILDNTK